MKSNKRYTKLAKEWIKEESYKEDRSAYWKDNVMDFAKFLDEQEGEQKLDIDPRYPEVIGKIKAIEKLRLNCRPQTKGEHQHKYYDGTHLSTECLICHKPFIDCQPKEEQKPNCGLQGKHDKDCFEPQTKGERHEFVDSKDFPQACRVCEKLKANSIHCQPKEECSRERCKDKDCPIPILDHDHPKNSPQPKTELPSLLKHEDNGWCPTEVTVALNMVIRYLHSLEERG